MRVLHLIDSGGLYGAESVILNLSAESVRDDRVTPVIGCLVTDSSQRIDLHDAARRQGIEAHRFVVRNARLPFDVFRLARDVARLDVDLVHGHGYRAALMAFAIRAIRRIPGTATCHLWFIDGGAPWKMRLAVAIEQRLYRYLPVVAAVSEPIRDVLVARGTPRERVAVVPNGVPLALPANRGSRPDAREAVRREFGLPANLPIFVNVGRLTPQKDQMTLVAATKRLVDQGMPLALLIVGEGDSRTALTRAIESAGIGDAVRLTGFRADTPRLLAAADGFVLSSLDEGMPMSLLEAVACLTPVAATPVGDVPRLIEHQVSGLLFRPGDVAGCAEAIRRLSSDPIAAERLANEAFQRLERTYSSAAMYAAYLEIYRRLLASSADRRWAASASRPWG